MKVSNEMNKSNVLFIFYTRVLAMFFVIIVHLCQENGNVLVRACAQFFITGVTIFIILTGYLYGIKARDIRYPENVFIWLKNRAKRILIPYYITVAFTLLMNAIIYDSVSVKRMFGYILMFFTCIQDFCGQFFYSIQGTGHLWYVTMLWLIYICIAFMLKRRSIYTKNNIWIGLGALYIFQITVTMFIQPKVGRYLFYIIICMTAYLYAYIGNDKNSRYSIKKKWVLLTLVTMIMWVVRLYLWLKGCNTKFYNNVYAYYSQAVLSVWFIYTFYWLDNLKLLNESRIITRLNNISYEVFLVHYLYINGALKIIGCLNNFIIESLLIIALSLITGNILTYISNSLLTKLNK